VLKAWADQPAELKTSNIVAYKANKDKPRMLGLLLWAMKALLATNGDDRCREFLMFHDQANAVLWTQCPQDREDLLSLTRR
jgi:hypothetical protein